MIAIGMIAGALGACGVKGDLELAAGFRDRGDRQPSRGRKGRKRKRS